MIEKLLQKREVTFSDDVLAVLGVIRVCELWRHLCLSSLKCGHVTSLVQKGKQKQIKKMAVTKTQTPEKNLDPLGVSVENSDPVKFHLFATTSGTRLRR